MASGGGPSDIFSRLRFFQSEENHPESNPENRPNPGTSRVKRCLFGRGDPEENIRFAKRELEKSLQDSKKRWNFDFEAERPLDGRFEWHSPYPRFPRSQSQETSETSKENSNPSNPCSKPTSSTEPSSSDSSKASSPTNSEKTSTAAAAKATSSTASTSEQAGSISQRTTRQSSINRKFLDTWQIRFLFAYTNPSFVLLSLDNFLTPRFIFAEIFRQRKRSKSKVKTQERRENLEHQQRRGSEDLPIGDTTTTQSD